MLYAYVGAVCISCLIAVILIGVTIKSTGAILKTLPPGKRGDVEEHQESARFYLLLPLLTTIYLVFFGHPDLISTVLGVIAIIGGTIMYRVEYYDYARKASIESLQGNRPTEVKTDIAETSPKAADATASEEKSGS